MCVHEIHEDPNTPHTQKSSSYHFYLRPGRKIKKALGIASLDAVKSKRKKGALSRTRREEKKQPPQKNYAWSNKGELQEAGRFGGMLVSV